MFWIGLGVGALIGIVGTIVIAILSIDNIGDEDGL